MIILSVMILFLPLIILIVQSFSESKYSVFPIPGWTISWYKTLLTNKSILNSIFNSLYISGIATIIALTFGTLAAFALNKMNKLSKNMFEIYIYLPMIAPGIIIGISLAFYFNLLDFRLGKWSVIIGHLTFLSSYVTVVVYAGIVKMDLILEIVGKDLGASITQVFLKIKMPILIPTFLTAGLFAWTLSFEEFIVTYFTTGTDINLSMEVFSKLRVGVTPELFALGTIQVSIAIIAGIIISKKIGYMFS